MSGVKKVLGFTFLLVGVFIAFRTIFHIEQEIAVTDQYERVRKQFHENPDVYGWINVKGTPIDYPIAQHQTDDSYYLRHDVTGQQTIYGGIFTERVNTKTFDDPVTIVYGHAMRDDAMFGSLDKFTDPSFFKQNRMIMIDTSDKTYHYTIIAAHLYTDEHLYDSFKLDSTDGMTKYVETLHDRITTYGGVYSETSIDVTKDKLLILSTCDEDDTQRYIITAKLANIDRKG